MREALVAVAFVAALAGCVAESASEAPAPAASFHESDGWDATAPPRDRAWEWANPAGAARVAFVADVTHARPLCSVWVRVVDADDVVVWEAYADGPGSVEREGETRVGSPGLWRVERFSSCSEGRIDLTLSPIRSGVA